MTRSNGTTATRRARRAAGLLGATFATAALSAGPGALVPDRDTGQVPVATPIWHLTGSGRGVPAFDERCVYFLGRDHEVIAVDRETGAVRWRQPTGMSGDVTYGARVVISGDTVIAADHGLVALQRSTGHVRWRFSAPAVDVGPYLGDAAGGLVFAGSSRDRIVAVDAASGRLRWSIRATGDARAIVFPPVADAGIIYAGFSVVATPWRAGLVAVDALTGAVRWSHRFTPPRPGTDAAWAGGPLLWDGHALAATGDGTVHAVSLGTGREDWRLARAAPTSTATPVSTGPDYCPLALSGDTLLVASLNGSVAAYDLPNRHRLWMYDNTDAGSVAFALTASPRAVYVPYVDGFVRSLDITTGVQRWRTPVDGFRWPVAVSADAIFVAGAPGGFSAYAP